MVKSEVQKLGPGSEFFVSLIASAKQIIEEKTSTVKAEFHISLNCVSSVLFQVRATSPSLFTFLPAESVGGSGTAPIQPRPSCTHSACVVDPCPRGKKTLFGWETTRGTNSQ